MMGQMAVAILATAGLLLALWLWMGRLLLPLAGETVFVVYRGRDDAPDLEQTVHSFEWLHDTGLVRTELVIEDHGMAPAARRRAETLARRHEYIRWLGPTQTEQVRCEGGSTAGDDTRERVGHRLSE
ncbi:hypothetical protein ACTQ33_01620 [Candidatus Avoscillospira sp. LCP25S3_F1]|uniref:hypothetical protein n=1 Tax=Candidatus Avoscillospira sp. LCP25S3_F1 TaxID=3438825 RepID=UPI003F936563